MKKWVLFRLCRGFLVSFLALKPKALALTKHMSVHLPIKVYLHHSGASAGLRLLRELQLHLTGLQLEGVISLCSTLNFPAGTPFDQVPRHHLEYEVRATSKSDFGITRIEDVEIKSAADQRAQGTSARVRARLGEHSAVVILRRL